MKESITKFDLEAAFKALDEIEIPTAERGIKANKPALNEIFSGKSKFDSLFEEYYDISTSDGLEDAKETREAEIAKAKLARIEKIVDLDADSPEDLLTSYVGKYIIQCPQCMTLFYKSPEDVIESEEDPTTVNVEEACQHCGNESGYTLIGKVGEAEPEEASTEATEAESTEDTSSAEEETAVEEETSDEFDFDLDAIDLEEEPAEEEDKKEESFAAHEGDVLVEELTDEADLDAKLKAHEEYIEYLRTAIAQEEEALAKADNEQIKTTIQKRLEGFKEDLENALPEAVKNGTAFSEESTEETQANAEEASEKQEEAYSNDINNKTLTEGLSEEAELDVSAEDFEKLISSPEFKKPISDGEARAMMNEFTEDEVVKEDLKETITENVKVNNEILKYAVINPDGTFAGEPCTSEEEARELAAQEEGRIIVKLAEADIEALTEAGFLSTLGKFGKTLLKKGKQTASKIGDAATKSVDKFADNTMTREEKADWVMKNTLKPGVKEVVIDNDGNAIPDEKNRKFDTYVVIGYKGYYSDGQTIGMSPTRTNKDLVIGMSEPQFRDTYTEAEELSKGWSMEQKGGPAFILLAKGKDISAAAYLCQYFKGELDTKQDQLENYFQAAKKDLEGKAHIAKGGGVKGDQGANEPKTEERLASTLKPGDIIVLGKTGAEILEKNESKFQAGSITIKVKMADGDTDTATFKGDQKVTVVIKTSNESLETNVNELASIMENLEELNENALEKLISQSLIETYKNVAGFRLIGCEYLNEELVVKGKVLFESGMLRNLSYKFTNALVKNKKITFTGLNEKLGTNKSFSLTGVAKNNIFVAESFKQHKKI